MPVVLAGPGTVLAGRYTLERELGRGGTATVYLGHDLRHHRAVAVKILRPEVAASLGSQRFLREIEIAAHLTHPHILPLHDSGETDELLYYVMPYVEGESLRERLSRQGALGVEEALRITREVADALEYAHAHGVVHRDIKPGNIMLESGHAVVADFGIARAISEAAGDEITSTGLVVGTPVYMSPEQATGSPVDGRSDIYSLGCVLYELLAGEPPFKASTARSLVARHLHDPVPSLAAIRPTLPPSVIAAVETALAKVPADRFATAAGLAEALATTGSMPQQRRRRARPGRRTVVAGLVLLTGIGLISLRRFVSSPRVADPGRVLVFPFVDRGRGGGDLPGEDAGIALVAALNSTASLTAIDAARLDGDRTDSSAARRGDGAARKFAQVHGAGFYVEATLFSSDSLHLLLDLHDARGGTTAHRSLAFGRDADGWAIGVRAALELLPTLIPTGQSANLPSLEGRAPQAMAEYFLGEQSYRRAAFAEALAHFRKAVGADSFFALAAVRGAQAASWNSRPEEATALARVAVARANLLPERQAELARGLDAWLSGRADSAVRHFRRVTELDPDNQEAWMGLAESFYHLLPWDSPVDSLAEQAFVRVHQLDPAFAPALPHLVEFAVRRGDVGAALVFLRQLQRGGSDPSDLRYLELALACVRGGMSDDDWREAVRRSPLVVSSAAQVLALGGLRQPGCARAAWEGLLAYDSTSGDQRVKNRFGALIGLQSVLMAQGRYPEVRRLLEADTLFNPDYRGELYLLDAMASGDLATEAERYAKQLRSVYRAAAGKTNSLNLWFLGSWEAHQGRAAAADSIAGLLISRASRADGRRDSLLARSLTARATLARGDSAGALALLQALTPTATSHADMTWNPWESLGGERLLLAQLLLARGEAQRALEVAANFDATQPIAYLIYLPASLSLRVRAAERLGDTRLAQLCRERLAALRSASARVE